MMVIIKGKILVVDDNEDLCEMLKDILEMEDFEVAIALDGPQALEQATEQDFDVVLMDIKMPKMDGVETFRKMKEIKPDTPVIMITAYAVEQLIREAMKLGAYAALKKPFNFDELLKTIDKARK